MTGGNGSAIFGIRLPLGRLAHARYTAHEGVRLSKEITASLFYYREVSTMVKTAEALGFFDRAAYYRKLQDNIKTGIPYVLCD